MSTEIFPFLKCNKSDISRSESFPDAILLAHVILLLLDHELRDVQQEAAPPLVRKTPSLLVM